MGKINGGITRFGQLTHIPKTSNLGHLNEISFEKFGLRFKQLSIKKQKVIRKIRLKLMK